MEPSAEQIARRQETPLERNIFSVNTDLAAQRTVADIMIVIMVAMLISSRDTIVSTTQCIINLGQYIKTVYVMSIRVNLCPNLSIRVNLCSHLGIRVNLCSHLSIRVHLCVQI